VWQAFLPAGKRERLPYKIRNQSWEQGATPPQARTTLIIRRWEHRLESLCAAQVFRPVFLVVAKLALTCR